MKVNWSCVNVGHANVRIVTGAPTDGLLTERYLCGNLLHRRFRTKGTDYHNEMFFGQCADLCTETVGAQDVLAVENLRLVARALHASIGNKQLATIIATHCSDLKYSLVVKAQWFRKINGAFAFVEAIQTHSNS